jgi:ribonuclease P protein component
VKARYRIRANERFQEIRQQGDAYHDGLLVLCVLANGLPYSRFGFSVSNRIGGAVVRNRIKRRLREAIRLRMEEIKPGWDIVFIAKHPIRRADYHQMDAACARLLRRAHLLRDGFRGDGQDSGVRDGVRKGTNRGTKAGANVLDQTGGNPPNPEPSAPGSEGRE